MAIICAALLCLRDIKLFTGIIGFFPEHVHTHKHKLSHTRTNVFHFVLNFLFFFSRWGESFPLLIYGTVAGLCAIMHSSYND